jgi:hypothetical protein
MTKLNEECNLEAYCNFWNEPEKYQKLSVNEVNIYFNEYNRSSTIFPIYLKSESKAIISFITYWVRKHNNKVVIKLTARDSKGMHVGAKWYPISKLISFIFDVKNFDYFSKKNNGFCGSIEIEVFSKDKPLFAFPAVSIFYENKISSSVVHAGIRSYNRNEKPSDYAIQFPQSGFDIVFRRYTQNYFCFIGGGKKEYNLILELETKNGKLVKEIKVKKSNYGKLHVFYIEKIFQKKFETGFGKLTINHNLDVFPRFYAGIIYDECVPTLTHSFFDTSDKYISKKLKKNFPLRAVNNNSKKYYDSAFMIPVMPFKEYVTEVRSYGQNLSFKGNVVLRVFNDSGKLLKEYSLKNKEQIKWVKWNIYNVSKLLDKLKLNEEIMYYVQIGFGTHDSTFPIRFKLALNVKKKHSTKLGTNICFSPVVQNQKTFDKPFSRRWFPLGGNSNFIAVLHLTDFKKILGNKNFLVELNFVNHSGKIINRFYKCFENSSLLINIEKNKKIKELFNGQLGWCFATCKRYLIDGYFFSTTKEQIGGDHVF